MEGAEYRRIKRIWSSFRIAFRLLLVTGLALVFIGRFVPGVLALGVVLALSAAAVNIAWREWARRVEERGPSDLSRP